MANISDIDISNDLVIRQALKPTELNRLPNSENKQIFHKYTARKLTLVSLFNDIAQIKDGFYSKIEEEYLSGRFCECCCAESVFTYEEFNMCKRCSHRVNLVSNIFKP